MEKTVCELFAGVGGFRCGLNHIKSKEDIKQEEWKTVWFSQWEPAETKTQYAHDCYIYNFGTSLDLNGEDTTNYNIEDVDKRTIPDHTLLVGGFPCQDYSVASTLKTSKGLEGKKGVLWWSIRDILEAKKPPFVLLENVDRLIKSPASQRGRDFGIILSCFNEEGYTVEWRVINASNYGYQQRRRRTFIFAYKNNTSFAKSLLENDTEEIIYKTGFFAKSFPIKQEERAKIKEKEIPAEIGELSKSFSFLFEDSGFMRDGIIYTVKTMPEYHGKQITLGDIKEKGIVAEEFFIPEDRLYYTSPETTHSDETETRLSKEQRLTWQYLKGAKKLPRTALNGHQYLFTEGAIPMIDEDDKPARTMLTSEGSFSRTTHIIRDNQTGRLRLLTPIEAERIQGFPDNHTKYCATKEGVVEMPTHKRRFMMGNALVVNVIEQMEPELSKIVERE